VALVILAAAALLLMNKRSRMAASLGATSRYSDPILLSAADLEQGSGGVGLAQQEVYDDEALDGLGAALPLNGSWPLSAAAGGAAALSAGDGSTIHRTPGSTTPTRSFPNGSATGASAAAAGVVAAGGAAVSTSVRDSAVLSGGGGSSGAHPSAPGSLTAAQAARGTSVTAGSSGSAVMRSAGGGSSMAAASLSVQPPRTSTEASAQLLQAMNSASITLAFQGRLLDSMMIAWDDLRVGRLLGTGGFGAVYKAAWQGIEVAVKTIMMDKLGSSAREQLSQEALIMCELRHPYIARIYGTWLTWPACRDSRVAELGFWGCSRSWHW
jgi:hypothetical protein